MDLLEPVTSSLLITMLTLTLTVASGDGSTLVLWLRRSTGNVVCFFVSYCR